MGNNSCNCLNISKNKLKFDFGRDSELLFDNIEFDGSNLNQKGIYSNRSNTNFTKKNTENSSLSILKKIYLNVKIIKNILKMIIMNIII